MKVLEITGEPILHGGQERFIQTLVGNINDPDIRIDVLTPYRVENQTFCETVNIHGGNVYSLDLGFTPGNSRRALLYKIDSFLANNKYDLVHIHSGSISALAYIAKAARRNGIGKVIVHSHATAANSLKHKIVQIAFRRMIEKNATDFLACSIAAGADKYTKKVVKKQLIVVPNGINVDDFKRDEEKRKSVRKELGISERQFVIGHVGRFSFEKNHQFLINVFENYRRINVNSRLLLVGDGELRDEFFQLIEEKALEECVIFTGSVDNVQDYYQAMDCFVFPSRYEGFGYVALEAQASGLPCVVSTNVPNDVLVGEHTINLPLENPYEWAKVLERFRNLQIVNNDRAITTAGYDIKKTIEVVKTVYRAL